MISLGPEGLLRGPHVWTAVQSRNVHPHQLDWPRWKCICFHLPSLTTRLLLFFICLDIYLLYFVTTAQVLSCFCRNCGINLSFHGICFYSIVFKIKVMIPVFINCWMYIKMHFYFCMHVSFIKFTSKDSLFYFISLTYWLWCIHILSVYLSLHIPSHISNQYTSWSSSYNS